MNDILTFDEIKSRFPFEWVLVGEPETDASLELVSGRVLCHSLNREDVDRKLLELRPTHSRCVTSARCKKTRRWCCEDSFDHKQGPVLVKAEVSGLAGSAYIEPGRGAASGASLAFAYELADAAVVKKRRHPVSGDEYGGSAAARRPPGGRLERSRH